MAGQEYKTFDLIDRHQRLIGEIAIEEIDKGMLVGRLMPFPEYRRIEHLFRRLEEAAELQALHEVDKLDGAIGALGLVLRSGDGSQEIAIRDVQIRSDGAITCRLLT